MKILNVGVGVIGTTYAYVFKEVGHKVEHLVREGKKELILKEIKVELLDGRLNDNGEKKEGKYKVNIAENNSLYDFIFVSVSAGNIEGVLKSLKEKNINGTIVLFSGLWRDKEYLSKAMQDWHYIIGYPVAGGSFKGDNLKAVIFEHVMLESKEKAKIDNYELLSSLFSDAHIKIEVPFDMLEWIWIHMAINAGVITTASKYGDINNTAEAAENIMNSAKYLSEAVLVIRETTKIIEGRGVILKNYQNELMPYKAPSKIAGIIMKKMFRENELTRAIMTLHSNIDDLVYVCKNVYDCGKKNAIEASLFYSNYEIMNEKLKDIN